MDLQDEILSNPSLLNSTFDLLQSRISSNPKNGNVILRVFTISCSFQSNGIPRVDEKIASRPFLDLIQSTLTGAIKASEYSVIRVIQQNLEAIYREDRGRNEYLTSRMEEMRRLVI